MLGAKSRRERLVASETIFSPLLLRLFDLHLHASLSVRVMTPKLPLTTWSPAFRPVLIFDDQVSGAGFDLTILTVSPLRTNATAAGCRVGFVGSFVASR